MKDDKVQKNNRFHNTEDEYGAVWS